MTNALFSALQDAGLHADMVGTYRRSGSAQEETRCIESLDHLKGSIHFGGDGKLELYPVQSVLPMTEVAGQIHIIVERSSLPDPVAEIEIDLTNPEDPEIWARSVVESISHRLNEEAPGPI